MHCLKLKQETARMDYIIGTRMASHICHVMYYYNVGT